VAHELRCGTCCDHELPRKLPISTVLAPIPEISAHQASALNPKLKCGVMISPLPFRFPSPARSSPQHSAPRMLARLPPHHPVLWYRLCGARTFSPLCRLVTLRPHTEPVRLAVSQQASRSCAAANPCARNPCARNPNLAAVTARLSNLKKESAAAVRGTKSCWTKSR